MTHISYGLDVTPISYILVFYHS